MLKKFILIGIVLAMGSACASFYETSYNFNQQFEQGQLDQALETLRSDKQYAKSTSKFLYFVNSGLLLSMKGDYEKSNNYFEKAYLFGEDYKVNYFAEAASFLSNPMITVYRGEDHEHLMPLYYKALNFMKMGRYEDALVECRRLNIRLQQLSDKYKSPEKFQRDAFIHNLMGIIYQANNDWNNAFIAYRNAYEIYEQDYAKLFNIHAPDQLKNDLLVSAWQTGFQEEYEEYKQEFGWSDFNVTKPDAELVFFWHNGLCPVKGEVGINFVLDRSSENAIVFANENSHVSFPFAVNSEERSDLRDMEVFRVVFPKYIERPVYYTSASLALNDQQYDLQLAEDVTGIAFKSLHDRMVLEMSKSLLRAALKKAVEQSARKEDKGFGALIGAVNAMTEKADTRNWQTLPHSILYARVPMNEGSNDVAFSLRSDFGSPDERVFTYNANKGQTLFHTFTSLETRPARY